jgi:hypothetical protein
MIDQQQRLVLQRQLDPFIGCLAAEKIFDFVEDFHNFTATKNGRLYTAPRRESPRQAARSSAIAATEEAVQALGAARPGTKVWGLNVLIPP